MYKIYSVLLITVFCLAITTGCRTNNQDAEQGITEDGKTELSDEQKLRLKKLGDLPDEINIPVEKQDIDIQEKDYDNIKEEVNRDIDSTVDTMGKGLGNNINSGNKKFDVEKSMESDAGF